MEVLGLNVPLDVVSPFHECINGLCFILNGAFYDQSAPSIRLIGKGVLDKKRYRNRFVDSYAIISKVIS